MFAKAKPDTFFTPSHYVPPLVSIPKVCSIMDLGYLNSSEQFSRYDYWQLRLWTAYSIKVSKYILTISESTRSQVVSSYGKYVKKTFITQLGYDKIYSKKITQKQKSKIMKKYRVKNDYILYLGTLKPSKNIEGIIKAWAKINKEYKNTKLVIAGKKGWLYKSIFELVESLDVKSRVVFTGFVTESNKESLIKGAKVFLLPSFWEGFGLDVLSSMASGVPCIVSDRGSLPEVAGDAGIYVNPDKVDSIADSLKKVLSISKKEYNELSVLGKRQAEKFSWEKTATETLKIFNKI